MTRHIYALAGSLALTTLSIASAFGHAGLEPAQSPPGSYRAAITVPHGCDGQATNTLKVVLPEGFVNAKPMPKAGWTLTLDKGDYAKTYKLHGKDVSSGLKSVSWSGGDLGDDIYDEFIIKGSLDAQAGARLPFIVTQTCANGEVKWDEIASDGQDAHALKHPAPFVTIAEADGQNPHAGHGAMNMGAMKMGDATDGAATTIGDIAISSGWARAMLPGQPAGGGYLTISNKGTEADRLLSVSTPAAGKAEVHEMKMTNDVMTMRPVSGALEIPAGGAVELKPGGLHLMFMQVKTPFAEGATVPLTLEFEKAGKVDIVLPVKKAGGQ